jgi:hypothetical protein
MPNRDSKLSEIVRGKDVTTTRLHEFFVAGDASAVSHEHLLALAKSGINECLNKAGCYGATVPAATHVEVHEHNVDSIAHLSKKFTCMSILLGDDDISINTGVPKDLPETSIDWIIVHVEYFHIIFLSIF